MIYVLVLDGIINVTVPSSINPLSRIKQNLRWWTENEADKWNKIPQNLIEKLWLDIRLLTG